jgi:hypothetical protein
MIRVALQSSTLLVALLVALAACAVDSGDGGDSTPDAPEGNATGGEDNTFDHPDTQVDIWDLLDKLQREGPPRYSSRVHACPKMKYETIGNVLASRGVDLGATAETSAGRMWRTSDQALGAPNYAARVRENLELTTASASKLFDIFVQAAPEIIANMPNRPECTVGEVGARMFNEFGQCTADGITCLIGIPATPGHIELCNEMVTRASTPETGQRIAVAALAAAAHTCE